MSKSLALILVAVLVVAGAAEEEKIDELQRQQQELSMKRTACLVLSRYHSNTQKETIEGIVTELEPEAQQKYINKLYAVAIEHCMPTITMDDAQRFFVDDQFFNPTDMFHIFDNFDYHAVAAEADKLTDNQKALIKFIKNFDEQMQVRREEREATKDESFDEDKIDMKVFGLSREDIPNAAKYVYIGLFALAVVGSIWYLMSKLDTNSKDKNKKKKSNSKSPAASPPKSPKTKPVKKE